VKDDRKGKTTRLVKIDDFDASVLLVLGYSLADYWIGWARRGNGDNEGWITPLGAMGIIT
jgi:hypothetical protein